MVFIWEREKLRGHAAALQRIERGKALGNGKAIIELAVNDELGRCPLADERRWVPFLVEITILPWSPAHVVNDEEQLLSRPVTQRVEDTVVADKCLEFAAEWMALDPV